MIQTTYDQIKDQLKTGDLVAFSGRGVVSVGIKAVTHSRVSHVGTVVKANVEGTPVVMIAESTSLGNGFAGSMIIRMSTRVHSYEGEIWVLPLEKTQGFDPEAYTDFLYHTQGRKYDAPQAVMSGLDCLMPDTKEDLSKLFCSEWVSAAQQVAGIDDPEENASEMTPKDLVHKPFWGEPWQIKGKPLEIY